jgi:hypothetical protein
MSQQAVAFDLEKLKQLMDEIPMPPILASSSSFPSDRAYSWEEGRREYVVAGKDFWDQLPRRIEPSQEGHSLALMVSQPLGSIPVHDLDHPAERELRSKVMASFIRARASGPVQLDG